jgi:hypothetical protein
MSDGNDTALRRVPFFWQEFFSANQFNSSMQFFERHVGSFRGATEIFTDAPKILFGDGAKFFGRFFFSKTKMQIF